MTADESNKSESSSQAEVQGAAKAVRGDAEVGDTGKNAVTSNAPERPRVPAGEQEIETHKRKEVKSSANGPKGTEEPGDDRGPGGTGW